MKIAYWVFCASKHNKKCQILTFGEIHTIRFSNFNRIRIRILFGLENQANTNTNIFGFEKSSEYEYEYYSVWKYLPNTNTNITIRSQLFEYYSNTELFAHLWSEVKDFFGPYLRRQTCTLLFLSSLLTPRKEGPSKLEGILEVGTRTLPICGHFLYNLSLRGVALNCKQQFVLVKKYFHILFLVV